MATLGKKMEEEEDAFWSHETWAEDEDSGNESFHESDEDSALRKDAFDSDFNNSESDNEDDEVAAGEAEERELRKSERAKRRGKSNIHTAYRNLDADASTRGKGRKGGAGGMKRAIGEGFNAGITLNLPPQSFDSLAYMTSLPAEASDHQQLPQQQQSTPLQSTTQTTVTKTASDTNENNRLYRLEPPALPVTDVPVTKTPPRTTRASSTRKSNQRATGAPAIRSSRSSSRERRPTHTSRQLRDRGGSTIATANTATSSIPKPSTSTTSRGSASAKRKRITQEELLLEAVLETEPENQRWLYARKRVQDQHDREKDSNASGLRDRYRGKKIVQKFHSRRGCLITLTFPEMDSVPEILTRRQQPIPQEQQQQAMEGVQQNSQHIPQTISALSSKQQQSNRCVITGKLGKYRDPITNHTYHNFAAFKELRRRHFKGIAIVTERTVVASSSKSNGGTEGINKRKVQNGPLSRRRLAKAEENNEIPIIAGNKDNNKKPEAVKRQQPDKALSSSKINVNMKLPFQSPKPPSNGKTANAHYQNKDNLEHLALSWGGNPNSSSSATNNTTQPSVCPNGRRLSPRKSKPRENVSETMAILLKKEGGGIAAVAQRGLGIKPRKSDSTWSSYDLDPHNWNEKSKIALTPNVSNLLAPVPTLTLVAPKAPSRPESNSSTIERRKQRTEAEKSVVNGDYKIPTDSCSANVVSIPPVSGVVGNAPSNDITVKVEDTPSNGNIMKSDTDKAMDTDAKGQVEANKEKLNGSNNEANRQT
eukprot:CAMPEP_0168168072 /NCGR_PEP_ID=MMETSP0139_2-20121125/2876_1 /TAXON_ID=44445 /ORGANISM="Pseudo-nitzschia australis, Strain 10249 10 AB" /LENGTH=763 /DNA_ID=CAMNT_0008085333 /DNA_START=277 /DNA_END=2568 /DNA_ORIENTATION=+